MPFRNKGCCGIAISLDGCGKMKTADPKLQGNGTPTRGFRSVGFPRSPVSKEVRAEGASVSANPSVSAYAPAPRPAPTKRAKGRWFISVVILSFMGTVAMFLWNEFGRYQARGIIEGRVVRIASPWEATVSELLVADGQRVQAGQLLARLDNADLKLRLAKIEDDMALARASIATRLAELSSRKKENDLSRLQSHIDYFRILSQVHAEKSRLIELQTTLNAFDRLQDPGVVSQVENDQTRAARDGQVERIHALEEAASQLAIGLEKIDSDDRDGNPLEADTARWNTLQKEWDRLRHLESRGEIRSPVTGTILLNHHWTGEFVAANAELFQILEEHTLQARVFVTQTQARPYRSGDKLWLSLPPHHRAMAFRIDRVDDEAVPAPNPIRRYYRSDERLVSLLAKPDAQEMLDTQGEQPVWLGAEVLVPRWNSWMATIPGSGE